MIVVTRHVPLNMCLVSCYLKITRLYFIDANAVLATCRSRAPDIFFHVSEITISHYKAKFHLILRPRGPDHMSVVSTGFLPYRTTMGTSSKSFRAVSAKKNSQKGAFFPFNCKIQFFFSNYMSPPPLTPPSLPIFARVRRVGPSCVSVG